MKTQESKNESNLEKQLKKTEAALDAVCTFVDSAKDLSEARFLIRDYLIPYKKGKREAKERIVPVDYYEKAKFVLQNFHNAYGRYSACVNYNKANKKDGFKLYGVTPPEFC